MPIQPRDTSSHGQRASTITVIIRSRTELATLVWRAYLDIKANHREDSSSARILALPLVTHEFWSLNNSHPLPEAMSTTYATIRSPSPLETFLRLFHQKCDFRTSQIRFMGKKYVTLLIIDGPPASLLLPWAPSSRTRHPQLFFFQQ